MPMPVPRKGEKKKKFISRFMSNSAMAEYSPKQRRAIAERQWERSK